MKINKIITLSSLALIGLGAAVPALADDEYEREYHSNAIVEFTPDEDPTNPVDPEDPDPNNPIEPWDPTTPENKPEPGTAGPLSIDFASSLDFGVNKITNKDETYFANPQYMWNAEHSDFDPSTARPNYVQISDKRGTNAGWTLQVKQEGQFQNQGTQNKELHGSQIKLKNGVAASNSTSEAPSTSKNIELDPSGQLSNVMSAKEGTGSGTWVDKFGSLKEVEVDGKQMLKNTDVELSVPGSTPKDAVKYSTQLTWILTDQPGNEEY
ncbi:TPA: WxL domain-containing protein [Enterococcus faecalis]|uniref:WxL domain-containing protein n=1 Tax=Enterococcus faecalis TaxID=1351 RepID=UPI001570E319|nr:WxL domain-containing protein [Enterococcus faecalis]EGO8275981.1 WxL domain-containing protein [Enterococcus faecalis]EGO8329330.1 WxL domain-containing protein [Enterococcus faecalis]EGO8621281.1 WxL domain-containing protein [Enterococcus faecalis]EJF8946078.1 WxL domain-containing protein [Enterococcus faecalis]